METTLTAEDARQSLNAHASAKGAEIREKYGSHIGWNELRQILEDRSLVRYPSEIVFDAQPLLPGEFAAAIGRSDRPEDGFTIFVHPLLSLEPGRVPPLVLYQLVVVNYGELATADDAETFGASALGLLKEEYYAQLCAMADEIAGDAVAQA